MTFSSWHSREEPAIRIPAIGLELRARLPPSASEAAMTIIDTVNAPGFGPPLHRHAETEIFRVLEGRYLYEVEGVRFHAGAGDVICVPGGAAHAFRNVTETPARQMVMILPGMDAAGFFEGLGEVMRNGIPDRARLNAFGAGWGVDFLGPPLQA